MPEEFYSLEEAAARLSIPPERLRQMAQRKEIRSYLDRGTLRFRVSDVEEMRRRSGLEASPESGPRTPRPSVPLADQGPRTPKPTSATGTGGRETLPPSLDVVPFEVGTEAGAAVDLASLFAQGPRTPGSDSDVRLVADGSDINLVVMPPEADNPPSRPSSGKRKPESQVRVDGGPPVVEAPRPRLSQLDVRPVDSDSDVRLIDVESPPQIAALVSTRHDSRIRLEPDHRSDIKADSRLQADSRSPEGSDSTLQLEINLDEQLQSAEPQRSRVSDSSEEQAAAGMLADEGEGTEFEGQGSEFELHLDEEETALTSEHEEPATFAIQDEAREVSHSPAADSSSNQPLTLDVGDATATEELSFDLSLDEEATEVTPRPESAKRTSDSDSEFELSVEDSEAEADTAMLGAQGGRAGPSLQEADTELEETSDFNLQLVDDEEAGAESSAPDTEVVIEEDVSDDQQTQLVEQIDNVADLDLVQPSDLDFEQPGSSEIVEEEVAVVAEEEAAAPTVRYVELAPADWGVWALVHVPTTLILVFVGLLMFELMRSVLYYHEPDMMGGQIFEMLSGLFRK